MPTSEEIGTFLREQYQLWNDGKIDEMMDYFRRMAPNGFTIQYVGQPVQDGEQSMKDMIAEHGGKVRTELVQLLVNGNEAATYVDNQFVESGASVPSIETYAFEDGKMRIRYFH